MKENMLNWRMKREQVDLGNVLLWKGGEQGYKRATGRRRVAGKPDCLPFPHLLIKDPTRFVGALLAFAEKVTAPRSNSGSQGVNPKASCPWGGMKRQDSEGKQPPVAPALLLGTSSEPGPLAVTLLSTHCPEWFQALGSSG